MNKEQQKSQQGADIQSEETMELIHDEIKNEIEMQFRNITILHQKSNWLLAIDVVVLMIIISNNITSDPFLWASLTLFLVSFFCILKNLWAVDYSRGSTIDELLEKKTLKKNLFQSKICKRKAAIFRDNQQNIKSLLIYFKIALIALAVGILLFSFRFILYQFQMDDLKQPNKQENTTSDVSEDKDDFISSEVHTLSEE